MRPTKNSVFQAAQSFCEIARPTKEQQDQLTELVSVKALELSIDETRQLCCMLSHSEHAPQPLVRMLCRYHVDICRPLLLKSQSLDKADLEDLIKNTGDLEFARIIARRPHLEQSTISLLRSLNEPSIDRAIELRQRPTQKKTLPKTTNDSIVVDTEMDERLAALCHEPSDDVIYTAFADQLKLAVPSAKNLCTNLKSKNLPLAMKWLGLSDQTAWRVYKRLARAFAFEEGIEPSFRETYRAIGPSEAARHVSQWQLEEQVFASKTQDVANSNHNQDTILGRQSA